MKEKKQNKKRWSGVWLTERRRWAPERHEGTWRTECLKAFRSQPDSSPCQISSFKKVHWWPVRFSEPPPPEPSIQGFYRFHREVCVGGGRAMWSQPQLHLNTWGCLDSSSLHLHCAASKCLQNNATLFYLPVLSFLLVTFHYNVKYFVQVRWVYSRDLLKHWKLVQKWKLRWYFNLYVSFLSSVFFMHV